MVNDTWFRFYNTAINHPKVIMLSDANFRAWVALMSLASQLGGTIPDDMSLIAVTIRKTMAKARDMIQVLLSVHLLDRVDGGYQPHNWTSKQFKSDVSTERVKRFRNGKRNVSETHHKQSTETEAEAVAKAREQDSNEINRLNKLLGFDERDFVALQANLRTLLDLKNDGCNFEKHILPAAEQAAKSRRARSLSYIKPKAMELRDAARAIANLPAPFENTDERGWRDRLTAFRTKGLWSPKWGPKPNESCCKCPPEILREVA